MNDQQDAEPAHDRAQSDVQRHTLQFWAGLGALDLTQSEPRDASLDASAAGGPASDAHDADGSEHDQ